MDRIWAAWRIGYIRNIKKEKGCLFCRLSKDRRDEKNFVLFRTEHSLVLMNIYPYNNGHLMVTPQRHVKSIELLSTEELLDLMTTVQSVKRLLDVTLRADGYNIGMNIGRIAGAGFDKHLHVHIVPRWAGDINFMSTLADIRVISQSLKELYKQLKKNLLR